MITVPFPVVGETGGAKSVQFSSEVTQNMYIERSESANRIGVHDFPGLKLFAAGNGADRGVHVINGILHGIQGGNLYRIDNLGNTTSLGAVAGTDRAIFADDGSSMYFVVNGALQKLASGTISTVTQTVIPSPEAIDYLNRKFILSGGTDFAVSDVGDGDTYNALNIAEEETKPDPLLRPYVFSQLAYMFGTQTTVPWEDVGAANPPLARRSTSLVNVGASGRYAITNTDQFFYFFGDDRKPYQGVGASARSISKPEVAIEFESISDASDCIASAFVLDGQDFVLFTFPSANKSFLYSEKYNYWVTLSSNGNRWYGNKVFRAYNKNLVVDYRDGSIYELDKDTFTDNGDTRIRVRTIPPFTGKLINRPGRQITVGRVRLNMQKGVGLAMGQGSSPVLMCQLSEDGGQTWRAEQFVDIGVMGDYHIAVDFDDFATGYDVRARFKCSDPVYLSMFDGEVDLVDAGD